MGAPESGAGVGVLGGTGAGATVVRGASLPVSGTGVFAGALVELFGAT